MELLPRRLPRVLMAGFFPVLLVACATKNYPSQEQVVQAAQALSKTEPVFEVAHSTAPIVLVGDNQENFNVSLPHIVINTGVDFFVPVTVRPPQHSLFGRQTLAYAIQETGIEPILHLGDIVDHSCDTELGGIFELFNDAHRAGKPWAAIMGNHDGLFNGLLNQPSIERRTIASSYGWRVRCRQVNLPPMEASVPRHVAEDRLFLRGVDDECLEAVNFLSHPKFGQPGHPKREESLKEFAQRSCAEKLSRRLGVALNSDAEPSKHPRIVDFASSNVSKDQIIERYLAQLASGSSFAVRGRMRSFSNEPEYLLLEATSGEAFVQRVEGAVLDREPNCNKGTCPQFTRSYFMQSISLPQKAGDKKFRLLLLDTTHTAVEFDRTHVFRRSSPGDVGFVGQNQVDFYAAEIERHKDAVLILGGHHPWGALDRNSKQRVVQAICRIKNPLIYLSAHTHNGYWAEHELQCGASPRKLIELNISSLADWPISFKRLSFEANADASLVRIKAPNSPAAADAASPISSTKSSVELLAAWKGKVCTGVTDDLRNESLAALDALKDSDAMSVIRGMLMYRFQLTDGKRMQLYRSSLEVHASSLRILGAAYRDAMFAKEFSDISVGAMPARCASGLLASEALRCHSSELQQALRSNDIDKLVAEYDKATVVLEDFRQKLRAREAARALSTHSRNLMSCLHVEAAHRDATSRNGSLNPVNSCQFIEQVVASNAGGLGVELDNLCQNKRGELR